MGYGTSGILFHALTRRDAGVGSQRFPSTLERCTVGQAEKQTSKSILASLKFLVP